MSKLKVGDKVYIIPNAVNDTTHTWSCVYTITADFGEYWKLHVGPPHSKKRSV